MAEYKNWEFAVIVLCSITFGACVATIFFFCNPVVRETYTYYNNSQVLQPYIYEYNYTFVTNNYTRTVTYTESKYDFLNIISDNADMLAYSRGIYDCKNFTNTDYYDLKSRGYHVDRYTTYLEDRNQYHAFLGMYIYIEPVSGRVLNPNDYETYGIPNLLRQYDGIEPDYYDNYKMTKDYREVCK